MIVVLEEDSLAESYIQTKEYKRKGPNGRIIFSGEATQEIIRRYRKGESTTRIGSDMGVSAEIILDALKERRVKLGWRRFRG